MREHPGRLREGDAWGSGDAAPSSRMMKRSGSRSSRIGGKRWSESPLAGVFLKACGRLGKIEGRVAQLAEQLTLNQ